MHENLWSQKIMQLYIQQKINTTNSWTFLAHTDTSDQYRDFPGPYLGQNTGPFPIEK